MLQKPELSRTSEPRPPHRQRWHDTFTEICAAILTVAVDRYPAVAVCPAASAVMAGSAMADPGTAIAPSRSAVSRQP
jgi:hypothetical protein